MDPAGVRLRKKIIALDIDIINYQAAIEKIIKLAKDKVPSFVCFANVHMIIEAYKDRSFADQVNKAALVLADGMPVVNALQAERIAGMDVMPQLIDLAQSHQLRLYFFGTDDELLFKIKTLTEKRYPRAEIAGMFAPPFGQSLNDDRYIDQINGSGANLVFVALGCPKQEKWMANNSSKVNAVLLGVGGAFPTYAGVTKRAPLWMRSISMEWLFRLFQEPTRLFKRYLTTNSLFLFLRFKTRFKTASRKKD